MSGFGQVTGQHFVCLLSAFCRFQNLETPGAANYFAHTNFTVTATMQIRKNILITLMILTALALIVCVYLFFNRRIEAMETKRQTPHSENLSRNHSSDIKS
jgi:hypothetical protein